VLNHIYVVIIMLSNQRYNFFKEKELLTNLKIYFQGHDDTYSKG